MVGAHQPSGMPRGLALTAAFLVGICLFAWLAGPLLETRFGVEALVTAYAGVAIGAGGLTYVLVRRLDDRLVASERAASAEPSDPGEPPATEDGGEEVTLTLDQIEIEREVERLRDE